MNWVGNLRTHVSVNEELIRTFVIRNVAFVIGGLAIAWYSADRQADDMNLLVDSTLKNQRVFPNFL